MRTIVETKTVYFFAELPEESRQKAVEKYWDINVDYDWWDAVYEDAKNIGLKITSFDDYNTEGSLTEDARTVITKILEDHGEMCETYQTAKRYHGNLKGLLDDCNNEDEEEQVIEDFNHEFLHDLLEDYRIMLRKEYEYLTSEETIKETLIANEYEFTEDGEII